VKRIAVAGIAGAGKSTTAQRLSELVGVPYYELDGFLEGPGWTVLADYKERIAEVLATDSWVTDSIFYPPGIDELLLSRADTVVWLDLPRGLIMRRLVRRTLRRGLPPRPVLVNGNTERLWAALLPTSPLRTAWREHGEYRARLTQALANGHFEVVHLRSAAEVEAWLAGLVPDIKDRAVRDDVR
jgi:adenylate kinase family enzyme